MSRYASRDPPPDGISLDATRCHRTGTNHAVISDGRPSQNCRTPPDEHIVADNDRFLAAENVAMRPYFGHTNTVVMRQDGNRARHRNVGTNGEKMGVKGLNICSSRREDDNVVTQLDAYGAKVGDIALGGGTIPLHGPLRHRDTFILYL